MKESPYVTPITTNPLLITTMAQTKITEIRELTTEELTRSLMDLKQEALNLRMQQATGQLENTSRRRLVRREIARVQTILTQRRQQG